MFVSRICPVHGALRPVKGPGWDSDMNPRLTMMGLCGASTIRETLPQTRRAGDRHSGAGWWWSMVAVAIGGKRCT